MQIRDRIEKYVEQYLPPDTRRWCQQYRGKKKIVHDALWGTFQLRAHEVALLDTPLLQRLRLLHQTGGVYHTYPSAHHTRFEHTLGVLCQAGRLCTALRGSSDAPDARVDISFENDVRFAALLHDTGHGPFSHTSEQFFSALDPMAEVRREHEVLADAGAGELLSYLIVRSKRFRDFVHVLNETHNLALDCDRIAGTITGTMPDDRMYMSEVIHGPFDADKLDYMPRDGMFSGLKMHVDIDRLYYSIKIKAADFQERRQTRIAGSVTGLSPLMQIMFNKMLLFTGMYHHHKVRAVDCMLWAIFHLATSRGAPVGGVHLECPVDFLRLTDDRLLIPELTEDRDIRKIIEDIRSRRLWKKALVIARTTVPEKMHDEAGESPYPLFAGVATLAGDKPPKIHKRREIADEIWTEAGKPCQQHEVWLDVPKPPGMEESKQTWIESPGREEPQILDGFIPVQQWVELYGTHQCRAHVFCPPKVGRDIGKAAEKVLYARFRLEFLPEARAYDG
jgi:HD superfamily phosphohydrolase